MNLRVKTPLAGIFHTSIESSTRRRVRAPGLQSPSKWSMFPVSQLATNARRYNRIYFLQAGPIPASLPYAQTSAGTTRPANLRAIVVSTLAGDPLTSANCPDPNGGTLSDADFN